MTKTHAFTMIELLIAVLIMSIALIASIQIEISNMNNHEENNHQQTVLNLIHDMAKNIYDSIEIATERDIDDEKIDIIEYYITASKEIFLQRLTYQQYTDSINFICKNNWCNHKELIRFNLNQWQNNIAFHREKIKGLSAVICRDNSYHNSISLTCTNYGDVIIKMLWQGKNWLNHTNFKQIVLKIQ